MAMIDILIFNFFILGIFLTVISWISFRRDIEKIEFFYMACLMFALSFMLTFIMGISMYIANYIYAYIK